MVHLKSGVPISVGYTSVVADHVKGRASVADELVHEVTRTVTQKWTHFRAELGVQQLNLQQKFVDALRRLVDLRLRKQHRQITQNPRSQTMSLRNVIPGGQETQQ